MLIFIFTRYFLRQWRNLSVELRRWRKYNDVQYIRVNLTCKSVAPSSLFLFNIIFFKPVFQYDEQPNFGPADAFIAF